MKAKYSLTAEHKAQLPQWEAEWRASVMSTAAMAETDRLICIDAVNGLYAARICPTKTYCFCTVAGGFAVRCRLRICDMASEQKKGRDRRRDSGRDSGCDSGRDLGCDRGRDSGCDRGRDPGCDRGRDLGCDLECDRGRDLACDRGRDQ